jgi:hypothetical protein
MEDPDHDLLAEQGGQRADAEVDRLGAELELHPAVLRNTLLGNVHTRDDLDARGQLLLDGDRRLGDLAQFAVDAEAHAVGVFVGFEMQVGRTKIDGVDQHLLEEAHDGCVFDLGRHVRRFRRCRVLFGDIEIEFGGRHRLEGLGRTGVLAVDQLRQLVVFDDHPFGAELGGELDAFGSFQIGGVGRRHEKTAATLAEHQQLVLGRRLLIQDVLRDLEQVDRAQVQQRQGQRGGQRVRQIGWRHGPR